MSNLIRIVKIPFKRGNTAQNNSYTGNPSEITIDTQKMTLRVHDGATPGGQELLRTTDLNFWSDPLELLKRLKTVDGAGSGLDADALDGHDSTYFGKQSDVTALFEQSSNRLRFDTAAQGLSAQQILNALTNLGIHTTDGLTEGENNLFFTEARARSSISVSGLGGNYDPTTGTITISGAVTKVFGRIGDVVMTKDDVTTALGYTPISTAKLGAAFGVATLGEDGRLTPEQTPAALLGAVVYQGVWDASTNTPPLTNGSGTQGHYYKVAVAGTYSINGNSQWNLGDMIIYNGATWDRIEGDSTEVNTVAGRVGDVILTTTDIGGLGTIATQDKDNISISGGVITNTTISGGEINNTPIGGTTASSGSFTTLSSTSLTVGDSTDGAILKMVGDGATTPNKYLRAKAGAFEIVSSDYSTTLFSLGEDGAATASRLVSTVANGTAPLAVLSSTLVENLNAELLDGQNSAYYCNAGNLNAGTVPTERLPIASKSSLGIVKIGSNLTVDENGVISAQNSYVLPVATPTVLGGIKVGSGLAVSADGTLSNNRGPGTIEEFAFEATKGQDTFPIPNGFTASLVNVYSDGRRLPRTDWDGNDGMNIVLRAPCYGGEEIVVEVFSAQSMAANSVITRVPFTATDNQKVFTVRYPVGALFVVLRNGVLSPSEYTATDGATVVFGKGLPAGTEGEFIIFSQMQIADVVSKSGDVMAGPLTLPKNGLSVGGKQITVTDSGIGIGTAPYLGAANGLSVASEGGVASRVNLLHYKNGASSPNTGITIVGSRGSETVRSAVKNTDLLGIFRIGGDTGTILNQNGAGIDVFAEEDWTATANGAGMLFSTTQKGTTAYTERMRISADGRVGIGVGTNPTYLLHVGGNNTNFIASGVSNAASTASAVSFVTGSAYGTYGSVMRDHAVMWGSGGTTVYGTETVHDVKFVTSSVERMRLTSGGLLSLGTASPLGRVSVQAMTNTSCAFYAEAPAGYTGGATTFWSNSLSSASTGWLHFYGTSSGNTVANIAIQGNGNIQNANNSYGGFSDISLKENIKDATRKLDKLMAIRVVNYNLKSDPAQRHIGVVAQEVEKIFPGVIEEVPCRDAQGKPTGGTLKSVKYSLFTLFLIKAVQELKQELDELKVELDQLKSNSK